MRTDTGAATTTTSTQANGNGKGTPEVKAADDITTVTPESIYQALIFYGASTTQAIGIMANMINESSLDPEAMNPAGPQSGLGLVQWQTTDYPHAATLVTGDPVTDMLAQVKYLAVTGGFSAASGSTPAEAAGNFAANYEKCASCQEGGAQYNSRVANAAALSGYVSSGKWPDTSTSSASGSTSNSGNSSDCLWGQIPGFLGWGGFCVFTYGAARAVIAAGLIVAGGGLGLVGLLMIAQASGMLAAAERAGGTVGELAGAGATLLGQPEIGGPVSAMSGRLHEHGSQSSAQRRQARARRRRENQAEDAELRAKGAGDISTARKPAGSLGQPAPGRVVASYDANGRRRESSRDRAHRYAAASSASSGNGAPF